MINIGKYHTSLDSPEQVKSNVLIIPEIEDNLSYKNQSCIATYQNSNFNSNFKISNANRLENERKGSDCSNIQYTSFQNHSFNSLILENNTITDKCILIRNDEEAVKKIVEQSINHKKLAAKLFKKNKYAEAAIEYQKAIELLNIDETFSSIINISNFNLNKIECMTNIAFCFYQMKKFEDTIAVTDEVLKIQNNVRALYFRAKALKNLDRIEEAFEDVKFALTIKSNQSLIKELNELQEKMIKKQPKNTLSQLNSPVSNCEEIEIPQRKENLCDENLNQDAKNLIEKNSNIMIKLMKILLNKFIEFIKKHKTISTVILLLIIYLLKKRLRFNTTDLIKVFTFNINSEY